MSQTQNTNKQPVSGLEVDTQAEACGRPVPGAGEAGHGNEQAQATPASNTGGR